MQGGNVPVSEMFGTFALSVGAAVSSKFTNLLLIYQIELAVYFYLFMGFQVGMEFWARWAHKALWHASLWNMHEVCFKLCYLQNLELRFCSGKLNL